MLKSGAIAGHPMQDVRVVVHDGTMRSTAGKVAFVAAGKKAFRMRVAKARPQVLEPIVDLEVNAPEAHMGDISGGLAGKRARINGTDVLKGGEIVVKAQVPLSELEGYAAELKSVTAGRGRYALDFSHYEPVPAQVQQRLVDAGNRSTRKTEPARGHRIDPARLAGWLADAIGPARGRGRVRRVRHAGDPRRRAARMALGAPVRLPPGPPRAHGVHRTAGVDRAVVSIDHVGTGAAKPSRARHLRHPSSSTGCRG